MTRHGLVLRRVEVKPGHIVDVRIRRGLVSEIGFGLSYARDEAIVDGQGGALLPGLNDHHLHIFSLAAAFESVACGPQDVVDRAALASALRRAAESKHPGTWIRGVGYHESVAGPLDRALLDEIIPDLPVRIQHRSGALWVVNSLGLRALDAETAEVAGIERDASHHPTGRLWRLDAWLRTRLGSAKPPDLAVVGERLAELGITGITDATPDLDRQTLEMLAEAASDNRLPQRIQLLGSGDQLEASGRLVVGPRKLVLADEALPSFDSVRDEIAASHRRRRPVAIHCVTRQALVLALAAVEDAGPLQGDRIEHAAVVPREMATEITRLGLRVVTQPTFVVDRGEDYIRQVPREDLPCLYPYASLLAAGVPVAPSSDAPFGELDPWRGVKAASDRKTAAGLVLGSRERVPVSTVLDGYLSPMDDPGGPPRRISVGVEADLCLLRAPWEEALHHPSRELVNLTMCAGRIVYPEPR